MEIQETSQREVARFLHHAEALGWNWVAFSARQNEDQRPPVFEGFISAAEAQAYCSDNGVSQSYPYEDDPYDVREGYLDYRFMPVETLQKAYQADKGITMTDFSLGSLKEEMNSRSVQLLPGQTIEQVLLLLQAETIFPVQWNKLIDPAQEVDRFHVIAHRHAGHQVYEIGHSTRVAGSFSSFEEADKCFKEQVGLYTDHTDKNDYLLIGQYKGRELIRDIEGWPESYSGITLRTANYQYDTGLKAKVWNLQEINTLDEPKDIRHFLYARFDLNSEKLTLYNDRLQEIKPEDLKMSAYPHHFNYERLTIKNSIAMEINMKNYDYLKNQAMFLGFGEEPAKAIYEKMTSGADEFTVPHQLKYGQDEVNSTLHFGKSNGGDLYFFNKFDLELKQPGVDEPLKQTYFIGKENNYTLKERYNMLDSRAVYKELNKLAPVGEGEDRKFKATEQTYKAWRALDFKQTDQRGNFLPKMMFWNHEMEIKNYPIKELETPYDYDRLLSSLEKGNPTKVTIIKDNEEIKGTIVANPRQASFDFYDSNNQRLEVKKVEVQKAQKQEQSESQNIKVDGENKSLDLKGEGVKVVQLQNNEQPGQSPGKEKKEDQKQADKNEHNDKQAKRQRIRIS
jgi:hypothetical protein